MSPKRENLDHKQRYWGDDQRRYYQDVYYQDYSPTRYERNKQARLAHSLNYKPESKQPEADKREHSSESEERAVPRPLGKNFKNQLQMSNQISLQQAKEIGRDQDLDDEVNYKL